MKPHSCYEDNDKGEGRRAFCLVITRRENPDSTPELFELDPVASIGVWGKEESRRVW